MRSWTAARDVAAEAGLAALLILAAAATIGVPDFGQAGGFLSGATSSSASAGALVAAVSWVVIIVVALLVVADTVRRMARPRRAFSRTTRAFALLVLAATLLAVAGIRHVQAHIQLCCTTTPAQVQEAVNLAR
ncbi:MAG: hypothetical protein JOY68_06135 [Candidatus Dormibacteraeota bacterium]|nr:hypothetical protein [Candidatus Dormibacteraeota bacterium]